MARRSGRMQYAPTAVRLHSRLLQKLITTWCGLLLVSLFAMALLGPRPSGFAARFSVAVLMVGVTIYAGRELHTLSREVLALTAVGGLALLFWEARDGTRAA